MDGDARQLVLLEERQRLVGVLTESGAVSEPDQLQIASRDDFGEVNEAAFIEVCRSASIITKDVRKILDEKLGFRNSCAHPSSIQVGDAKVVSFIEDLVDNVIAKHPV